MLGKKNIFNFQLKKDNKEAKAAKDASNKENNKKKDKAKDKEKEKAVAAKEEDKSKV